jgi:hypothetical protein
LAGGMCGTPAAAGDSLKERYKVWIHQNPDKS